MMSANMLTNICLDIRRGKVKLVNYNHNFCKIFFKIDLQRWELSQLIYTYLSILLIYVRSPHLPQ